AAAALAVTVTVLPPEIVTVSAAAGEPPAPVHPAFQVTAVPPFQLPLAFDVHAPAKAEDAPRLRAMAKTIAARIRSTRTAAARRDGHSGRGNRQPWRKAGARSLQLRCPRSR